MSGRVCAIVVTYNRAALLGECLAALAGQTRPPDGIVVVDNAGTDGTRAMLRERYPAVPVLALPRNVGGAGGFHAGMKWAYGQGYDWLWLMDDDGRPAPDCLARLLAHARSAGVLVPLQQDSGGRLYGIASWRGEEIDVTADIAARGDVVDGNFVFRFVGPLISRTVIERAGLPHKDYFIWFDDLEYALRIQRMGAGAVVAVPDARFFHDFGGQSREARFLGRRSIRNQQPPWKLYYGARNYLYTVTRTRRDVRELLLYCRIQLRFLVGEIIFEPDRWQRVGMRLRGFRDGALGRLGKRV
jgi:rhamnopyranosyl-N-acetylglucosaminyl-diphospho-decaprenol beta-1,3/1,4-galactofuranosyltransferase